MTKGTVLKRSTALEGAKLYRGQERKSNLFHSDLEDWKIPPHPRPIRGAGSVSKCESTCYNAGFTRQRPGGRMAMRIIGEDFLARDEGGRLRVRIATVFPHTQTVVTLPGIHATQRFAYAEAVNAERAAAGQPPMNDEEEEELLLAAVDLVMDDHTILIRPDPDNMALAFEADELLQQRVSKKKIKFLFVMNPRVRDAIRRRGERWRISPLPRSPEEMRRMIESSRIGIGGREIYYYNKTTGTRLLTYDEFCRLAELPESDLRHQLEEIARHCASCNRMGNHEIEFFMAGGAAEHAQPQATAAAPLASAFNQDLLRTCGPADLRAEYESLRRAFRDCVLPDFQRDDVGCPEWRSRMYAALLGHTDEFVNEESLLGLSAEFFMQVEWLPGGRIEEGEVILDPVFEEEACYAGNGSSSDGDHLICDERARGFIFNFIRSYGNLEYVNIGRVGEAVSSHRAPINGRPAHRAVYLAEVKHRGSPQPLLRIIRIQKWSVREYLDSGRDLLSAVVDSEEYTEYILDRRLGCIQLGMNLSPRSETRKVGEVYHGPNRQYQGTWVRSTYFERDYVPSLASDKIPTCRFQDEAYALAFARLMGRAAAPNLIVGRVDSNGGVVFDRGDELIVEDEEGVLVEVVIADHTGTFADYRRDLLDLAPAYAAVVNRRADFVPDRGAFARAFLDGLGERLAHIRGEHVKRKRGFDTLFKHLRRDEGGSFAYRWERVLHRLEASDPARITRRVAEHLAGTQPASTM